MGLIHGHVLRFPDGTAALQKLTEQLLSCNIADVGSTFKCLVIRLTLGFCFELVLIVGISALYY